MATNICPTCNKEIGNDISFCPNCGTPIKIDSVEKVIELPPEKNTEGQILSNNTNQPSPARKGKLSKKNKIIATVIAVIIIIGSVFGIKSYMDNKTRQEYIDSYNKYVDNIEDLKNTMLTGAASAESLCNLTNNVWYNAIWKKTNISTDKYTKSNGAFVTDFNDALYNLSIDPDIIKQIVNIETNVDSVNEKMKKMKKYPEDMKNEYETLQKMYDSYISFTSLAIKPTGSYKSYNENITKLDTEFMDLYKKVDNFDLSHLTK